MHNYICGNMEACLCFTTFYCTYLIGYKDSAGVRQIIALCFNIKVCIYDLLLEIGYVTSYNSIPIASPFTEVNDSIQSL